MITISKERITIREPLDETTRLPGHFDLHRAMYDRVVESLSSRDQVGLATMDIARQHTLAVEGAHQSSPVRPIAREFLELSDDKTVGISRVEEILERGFARDLMPSEMEVPWSQRGQRIALK